jgi:hypothetical protein
VLALTGGDTDAPRGRSDGIRASASGSDPSEPINRFHEAASGLVPLARVEDRKPCKPRHLDRNPDSEDIEPRLARLEKRAAHAATEEVDETHAAEARTEPRDQILRSAAGGKDRSAVDARCERFAETAVRVRRRQKHRDAEPRSLAGDRRDEIGRRVGGNRCRHGCAAEVGREPKRAEQRIEGAGDVGRIGVVRGGNEEVEPGAAEFMPHERRAQVAPRACAEVARPRGGVGRGDLRTAEPEFREPRDRLAHAERRRIGGERRDGRCEVRAVVGRGGAHAPSVLLAPSYDPRMRRAADIVLLLSISLWLACAAAGGIAAAGIFPVARTLDLSLAGYEAFLAAYPEEGRMLVAGFFAERVFMLSQTPRLVLAALAVAALAAQLKLSPASPLRRLRIAALAVAAAALLAGSLWATSDFRAVDRRYRDSAAHPASIEQAIALKPALDAAHARASNVMTVEVLALLGLIGLTAFAAGGARPRA